MSPPGWLKFLMVVAFGAIMFGVSQFAHHLRQTENETGLVIAILVCLGLAGLMTLMGWGLPPEPERQRDPRPWTRRVAHRIATLGMGWAGLAVAPIFAPAGKFMAKREQGAAIASAALSASMTFLFASAIWLVAVGLPTTFLTLYFVRLIH